MKRLYFALLLFFIPFCLFSKQIVIYHTSDTHGFFYPELDRASGRMQGGFAAAQNIVKAEPLPHILFDSGDYSNGTAEVKDTKGAAAIKIMNAMGYAAATIGNHEFDFGEEQFLQNLKLFNFPVLSANTFDSRADALLPNAKPYDFFEVNGVKIAVIGIGKEGDNKFIKFKKPQTVIKPALEEIKKQNPAVTVLLIHDSYDGENADIAKKFPEINIILGGHAHKEYQNIFIGKTLLVESGAYLKTMSKITVDIDDKTGKFKSAGSQLIPLYIDAAGEDTDIKRLAGSLRVPGMDETLGRAAEYISKNPVKDNCFDSPLNNWIADVMLANVKADFSVQNTGSARISLEQGPVTLRDMISLFPFDNRAVAVTVDGIFVKRLVRDGIKNNKTLYAYGNLTAKFKNKNNKIKNLQIFINGKPVENHKTYTLVTNEYIAGGNTEGWMFKRVPQENKKILDAGIRAMLVKNLKQNSPLKPANVCRLQEIK
ncbi:MAG: bifunctional metallophosphatase/5'-nucleotidase [Elusimicrobium sp.]|jgi:2',3'-cyclic-nucleotide 2'-phosphodiesterase (5'-nucleotidase family)|nr:bifunctional metallophosphatase/5'-nucleotidase [Elusimicrobium sp.]